MNMESNDELTEINIKNLTCFYFDEIIKFEDFNVDNILINEKSYGNILVYHVSQKIQVDAKPLVVRFDKIDGSIRVMEPDIQYYLELKI